MSRRTTPAFNIGKWDEVTLHEGEGGRKMTRADVLRTYSGAFEGESTSVSVMCYTDAGTATFVGLEHFVGRLEDRAGSFVAECNGTYANGVAKQTGAIVPDSGTGELRGIRGRVTFEAGHQETYEITLEYELDSPA